MLGTVSLSVACATMVDFIAPNFVYSWREKLKAHSEKRKQMRVSYHHTKGRRKV